MIDIFERSSQVVDDFATLDPLFATSIGIAGHDDRWPDFSPAGAATSRALWAGVLEDLAGLAPPDRRSEVALRVLRAEAERSIRAIDRGDHLADLNNIASPWQAIRTVFSLMATETAANWQDICTRLETIEAPLVGYRSSLEAGASAGRSAARRQVRNAIEEGRVTEGPASSFLALLGVFDEGAVATEPGAAALRARLVAAISVAQRAYGAATDWLERSYLPDAPARDGVGRERYIAAAEAFLGETIDPEEVYSWGWAEIDRLRGELVEVCARIDPSRTVDEVMSLLNTDPARGVEGVEAFLEIMQARQEQALAELDGVQFDIDERFRAIEVHPAPAGGATAPYYTGPSEDFSRPGRVWYPVDGRTSFPLYEEITTAYHEGFPGHHLQIGWQVAMGDELSRFHRNVVWYPGAGEGWALYAERLMGELGYLERPEYEVGLLTSQLFRSCRIVIDIGCHLELAIPDDADFHPGEVWSYELGVEMLRTVAFQSDEVAESEMVRYLGWPGQAISYKVGERAILDLRARRAAEADFDLRTFHADLLSVGSIGLDLLRELVA